MKAEELMRFDWVHLVDDNTPRQVDWIRRGEVGLFWNKTVTPPYLEPIPLTPEILEKNGFHFGYTSDEEDMAFNTIAQLSEKDKGWVWDEGDGSIKVIFPNESDGGLIIIDDQSFDKHLTLVFSEDIHIHKFQHTLRLCGIEKEIEL